MDTALESRIRAAGAEMGKPGRWRIALQQLDQAAAQLLSSPDADPQAIQLTLDNLYALYQWSSVMQSHELHRLNADILKLSAALETV